MVLKVNLKEESYDIVIEKGALTMLSSLIQLDRKVLIVTDSGIPKEYVEIVQKQVKNAYTYVIEQGETSKNFKNYYAIISYLIEKSFTRTDCIIALGGGVVGDLAGFVSSTYKRGIDFYNIPTTLLAMVDSSIGGKTAIDFENAKNVVGTFYQPKKVIIDPLVLKTLDSRLLSAGLVEAIKMAVTFDQTLFDCIKNATSLDNDIENIIACALKIKKEVVEQDPKEKNLRKVLNFGHTIGHAIESCSLNTLYHGECVGLGMLSMCSEEVKKEITEVLKKYHLPLTYDIPKENLIAYIGYDKKVDGKKLTIIYVEKIGTYEMRTIDVADIIRYL